MQPKTKRQQIAAERNEHNRRIENLRSQYAPSKDLNREYVAHQRKLASILDSDEKEIVGGRSGRTA